MVGVTADKNVTWPLEQRLNHAQGSVGSGYGPEVEF